MGDNISKLARGITKAARGVGEKIDVSQFLKNLVTYSLPSQATRDYLQNIQNVALANRVKRVETPEFTNEQLANMGGSKAFMARPEVEDYQDRLSESQFAAQSLRSELENPTMNQRFNEIFNVPEEERQRQSGAQLYGITPENPQGKFFSPTVTRDLLGGAGMALGAGLPGMTQGMSAMPRAVTNIVGQGLTSAGESFGSSTPSSATWDTIIGGLLGSAGAGFNEYASNPEFRQFVKDKNSGKYDAYFITGDELGTDTPDVKKGQTYQDMISDIQNDTTPQSLLDEAKKYKSAEEFVKANTDPLYEFKTLKTIKDPYIARGTVKEAIDDIGGIKNVERGAMDITKIQTTEKVNMNSNRAKAVVDEVKSGIITPIIIDEYGYIMDGHHRLEAYKDIGLTEIPVIAPKGTTNLNIKTKSQLTDIWNKAQDIPIGGDVTKIKPEPGMYGSPEGAPTRKPGMGNVYTGSGKPLVNEDSFFKMIMEGKDPGGVLENMNFEEKDLMSDVFARNIDKTTNKSMQVIRDFANKYAGTLQDVDEETRKRIYENYKNLFKKK